MNTTQEYWSQLSAAMLDKTVGGEYQLIEVLGNGAFGCLFLGQAQSDNSYVAVKVLTKAGLDHEQLKLQQLEIDIQSALNHPYLLRLHRVIQDDQYIFMVMELCDQGDLFDYVIRDQQDSDYRDEGLVKNAFLQILEGIEHMHAQNIYHRDIKLENILLKYDDDEIEFVCKVADFGLATRERYSLEYGCGSSTYLAPEHFEESGEGELMPYDVAASDCWSLGILLLAFLFGRNPWEEATISDPSFAEFKRDPSVLRQLFPELSSACFAFVKAALTIDPTQRPSVSELKKLFLATPTLYASDEEDLEDTQTPVDIPQLPNKSDDRVNRDSAFFSASLGMGSMSWSDMVEEDERYEKEEHPQEPLTPRHEEYDDTMFVHNQEKESWWL
ncbi:kinase-like domain-containing protein [Phycomyces nitens]|nr:kinase-like domain-containing protein [Phycomyces nitens]